MENEFKIEVLETETELLPAPERKDGGREAEHQDLVLYGLPETTAGPPIVYIELLPTFFISY
jgi:hypothetical protein